LENVMKKNRAFRMSNFITKRYKNSAYNQNFKPLRTMPHYLRVKGAHFLRIARFNIILYF
jgi:hypothetical protein